MSVVVPITRREFVQRPSVVLVPLPPRAAADPMLVQAAHALDIDAGAVEWGRGLTLIAPLIAEDGRMVTVHARSDGAVQVAELALFAPGSELSAVARLLVGQGAAPLSLRLRVLRSERVAAVQRLRDGRVQGVLAELRLLSYSPSNSAVVR